MVDSSRSGWGSSDSSSSNLNRPITIHADGEVICGFGTDVKNVKVEVVPEALEIII